ncbi:unnamed protein product [Darwinula stevensoni]|uniref:Lipase domain-containing protein n=1 Tax=Darwinula stevensoni TaxID=69355 RepID=A0A7R8XF22_9CRUS|nr:unnamed protein product [Darwinula stevensoni]CAG0895855.1 unnamed protein product [Darwinula stevensoni]
MTRNRINDGCVFGKREAGTRMERVHVAGHSLGSHVASYIGSALKDMGVGKLGRITGLDPAGPQFEHADPRVRLDPEDALFVDAIHTDGVSVAEGGQSRRVDGQSPFECLTCAFVTGLGTLQPFGHMDFYPNSGARMPGCSLSLLQAFDPMGSFVNGLTRFTVCSHTKAYEYFTESINSPCPFLAHQCSNWVDFV